MLPGGVICRPASGATYWKYQLESSMPERFQTASRFGFHTSIIRSSDSPQLVAISLPHDTATSKLGGPNLNDFALKPGDDVMLRIEPGNSGVAEDLIRVELEKLAARNGWNAEENARVLLYAEIVEGLLHSCNLHLKSNGADEEAPAVKVTARPWLHK